MSKNFFRKDLDQITWIELKTDFCLVCKNEYVLKNGSAENNSAIDFLSLFLLKTSGLALMT